MYSSSNVLGASIDLPFCHLFIATVSFLYYASRQYFMGTVINSTQSSACLSVSLIHFMNIMHDHARY